MTMQNIAGANIALSRFRTDLGAWTTDITDPNATSLLNSPATLEDGGEFHGAIKVLGLNGSFSVAQISPIKIESGQYIEVRFLAHLKEGTAPTGRIIVSSVDANGVGTIPLKSATTTLLNNTTLEVSAIIGMGKKDGVDLLLDANEENFRIGFEITANQQDEIYIYDLETRDVSAWLHLARKNYVDVTDFNAFGDGNHDCYEAFSNADNAAQGRTIFVPAGTYYISKTLSLKSPLHIVGKIIMPDDEPILLRYKYDYQCYYELFKNETLALKKALQALFYYSDHTSLDLCGRNIQITESLDVGKLSLREGSFHSPRIVHNGQISAKGSSAWQNSTTNASASYSASNNRVLSDVTNISDIAVGSLVEGAGVGRDVYVTSKDEANQRLFLSEQLYSPAARQSYKFTKFQFMFDFYNFESLRYFSFNNVIFECASKASAINFAKAGSTFTIQNCWFNWVGERAILSIDEGCSEARIENNSFTSSQYKYACADRTNICISTRRNDIRIANNVSSYFRHFAIMGGAGHTITANHFYQDNLGHGTSFTAGLIFTYRQIGTVIADNYIDHCWVELSNEHDTLRSGESQSGFGGVALSGNYFTVRSTGDWFRYLVIRPYGENYGMQGMIVTDNVFVNHIGDKPIPQIEHLDENHGYINDQRITRVRFSDNSYSGITKITESPCRKYISKTSKSADWFVDYKDVLPFGLAAQTPEGIVLNSNISNYTPPRVAIRQGSNKSAVRLLFNTPTKGGLWLTVGVED